MPFEPFQPPRPARRDTPASLLIAKGMRRIADERNWCKDALCNEERTAFCALGSMIAFRSDGGVVSSLPPSVLSLLNAAASKWGYNNIVIFNNRPDTTHADVLACMEEARLAAMEDVPRFGDGAAWLAAMEDVPAEEADAPLYEGVTGA